MQAQRIDRKVTFTKREAKVVHETLVHLSAYTEEEMRDHLDWAEADIRAWSSALGKLTAIKEHDA